MSEILTKEYFKKLDILFAWSQFYQNSPQLTVNRYPENLLMCKYKKSDELLKRYYPFNQTLNDNRRKYELVQKEITKLNNK